MKPIRIIPRLDVKNNNLIKGINLEGLRVLGNPYDYAETYYKNGADEQGRAHVGTVDPSDNSISFGSEATFNAGNCYEFDAAFDSTNNKIVVSYRDFGNSSYGTAAVGTVSGTSITFGSEVVFNSAAVTYTATTLDSSNNKVVISYRDGGDGGKVKAKVGTVSGTSISFGSASDISTGNAAYSASTFDTNSNKVISLIQLLL